MRDAGVLRTQADVGYIVHRGGHPSRVEAGIGLATAVEADPGLNGYACILRHACVRGIGQHCTPFPESV